MREYGRTQNRVRGGRGLSRMREKREGFPEWQEPGGIEKILQHFVIFCNINGTKRQELLWKGTGTWSERNGKRDVEKTTTA